MGNWIKSNFVSLINIVSKFILTEDFDQSHWDGFNICLLSFNSPRYFENRSPV